MQPEFQAKPDKTLAHDYDNIKANSKLYDKGFGDLKPEHTSLCIDAMCNARSRALNSDGFLDNLGEALIQVTNVQPPEGGPDGEAHLIITDDRVTKKIAEVLSRELKQKGIITSDIEHDCIIVVAQQNVSTEWHFDETLYNVNRYDREKRGSFATGRRVAESGAYIIRVVWVLSGAPTVALVTNMVDGTPTFEKRFTEALLTRTCACEGNSTPKDDLFYHRSPIRSEDQAYATFLGVSANTARVTLVTDCVIQPGIQPRKTIESV